MRVPCAWTTAVAATLLSSVPAMAQAQPADGPRPAPVPPAPPGPPSGSAPPSLEEARQRYLTSFDQDGDGRVSREEFSVASEARRTKDGDRERAAAWGALSEDQRRSVVDGLLDRADLDGDGFVTLEELGISARSR